MMGESRGFSRIAAAFSRYDGEFRLPLVLAQGSPIFHSKCERVLGIALELLQGKRVLISACVQDLMFPSKGVRDPGVAFQTHPGVRPRLEG